MSTSLKLFTSHILRYVGVGLISGSIVHAGTLGGDSLHYVSLILLGVLAFTFGTYLENENKFDKHFVLFIFISVIVSLGTGMVSGSTQHYLDGPIFASVVLPLGLLMAYIAFMYRDYKKELSAKKVLIAVILTALLGIGLYALAHKLPDRENHHSTSGDHH